MKNNYSIAQRNAIVEANLWCIDSVIRQNRPLMRAARLEYDDVYQQLALRLIKAVAGYDPEKGRLEQHIFAQLKYELLSCKSAYRLCGRGAFYMETSILSAYSKNECQKYFDYLERLRQSGETNMYGAVPYLQEEFPELRYSPERARKILLAWFGTFREKEADTKC